jgi:four helix bundle protein
VIGTDHWMSDYTKLEVWQKSRALARDIYKASESFPPDEKFGLTHQIRRAVVSIPSNIAEGEGRGSGRDRRSFILIARGSAFEVETQLFLAEDLRYISSEKAIELRQRASQIARMLSGLIRYYSSKASD